LRATEIHIFKLETTSSLTPGDIKAVMNRVKGYMRYSLICGCLSHSTTPPKDAARGAPEPGSVDKTKAPGEPIPEGRQYIFIPYPEDEHRILVLYNDPDSSLWKPHPDNPIPLSRLFAKKPQPSNYKETRTGADPAPHLQAEQQYEENNGGGK